MTIKRAYTNGFQQATRSPRMIFTLYITNFLLVALFALTFYNVLSSAIGNSMIFNDYLKTDQSILLSDILHNSGKGIMALVMQLKWALIAYWILNIFLVGGVIRTFNKQKFSVGVFFAGAGQNFGRFMGLSVLIALTHIVFIALIILGATLSFNQLPKHTITEQSYIFTAAIAFLVYFLIAIVLFLASDFGKFYLLLNDSKNVFKAYYKGIWYVFRKFFKTYTLYLALLVLPIVFFYLFTKINGDIGMNTVVGLIIMFFVQQAFIFVRFGFRVWILGSLFEVYGDDFLLLRKIALEKERLTELAEQKAQLSKMMKTTDTKTVNENSSTETTNNVETVNTEETANTTDLTNSEEATEVKSNTSETVDENKDIPLEIENDPETKPVEKNFDFDAKQESSETKQTTSDEIGNKNDNALG